MESDDEILGFNRKDANALLANLPGQDRRQLPRTPMQTSVCCIAMVEAPPGGIAGGAAADCKLKTKASGSWADLLDRDSHPVKINVENPGSLAVAASARLIVGQEYLSNIWLVLWEAC